jgi:CrcB protein
MNELLNFTAAGIGSFIGACIRYFTGQVFARLNIANFPYGTLAVNIAAGTLIGVIFALSEQTALISPRMKIFLMTGIMGGLSTLSALSLDTINFWRTGNWFTGFLNLFLNIALCLAGTFIGITIVKS